MMLNEKLKQYQQRKKNQSPFNPNLRQTGPYEVSDANLPSNRPKPQPSTRPIQTMAANQTTNNTQQAQQNNTNTQAQSQNQANTQQKATTQSNNWGGYNPFDDLVTKNQLEDLWGFDYSRDYAKNQAQSEAQALRDAIADSQRRNSSNKEENLQAIDNNLMNMADSLDRNYFQKGMQQRQNQVSRGINGGVAADQDLRMAMSRQAEMGGAYRDANLGKMQENNRFTNNDLRLSEQLGTVNQQALAREDSIFNQRNQEALNNSLQVSDFNRINQQQRFGQQFDLMKMMEDSRRYDMQFGIQEGELTGNYLPSYLQGNKYNNPFSGGAMSQMLSQYGIETEQPEARNYFEELFNQKAIAEDPNSTDEQRAQAHTAANEIRNHLGSMGIDVSKLSGKTNLSEALKNMTSLNPTMANQQRQFENGITEGQLTGNYVSDQARGLIDTLLGAKQVAENPSSTDAQRKEAHETANGVRQQLASMGIDPSGLGAGTNWAQAIQNTSSMNKTMAQRLQDSEIAFKESDVTGSYENPENVSLLQRLFQLKSQAESGKGTPNTSKEADVIRQQLAANGVDVSKFGKGVNLKDALNNVGSISDMTMDRYMFDKDYGLKKDQMAMDKSMFNDELKYKYHTSDQEKSMFDSELDYKYYNTDQEKSMFDSELGYKYDQLDEQGRQFDSELGYKNKALDIDTELKSRGLDIDEMLARLEEEKLTYGSDGGMKINPAMTNQYNAQIAKFKDLDDALDYVAENGEEMAVNGADLSKIRSFIESQFRSEINRRNKEAQNSGGAGDDWMGKP